MCLLLGKVYIPYQMVAGATRSVVSSSDYEHSRVPAPHFESYTDQALSVQAPRKLVQEECTSCIRFKSCSISSKSLLTIGLKERERDRLSY